MRRNAFRGAAIALLGMWLVSATGAAVVRMRDGQMYDGEVRLENGQLVVKRAGMPDVNIDPSAIQQATIRDFERNEADKNAEKPKAPEKPKPGPLHGLRGEYCADRDLKDLKLVRVDPKIEFYWPQDSSPDPWVPKEFAVRWTGLVEPAHSGNYMFHIEAQSGAKLWIDGKLIIDRWMNAPGVFNGTAELKSGRKYDLKMEYHNSQYGGLSRLAWSCPKQNYEIIPLEKLYPPTNTKPPTAELLAPLNEALVVSPGVLPLEAGIVEDGSRVRKVRFFADGQPLGMVEKRPWKFEWKNPAPGHHRLRIMATDEAGITSNSEQRVHVAVGDNAGGALPVPWAQMQVGTLDSVGSLTCAGGTMTVRSHGGDFWGDKDVFHYVFQPLRGDGSIVARLKEFKPGGAGAAAGLLIRDNLAPAVARQAFLGLAPEIGLVFVRRVNNWEERKTTEDRAATPCWLRLTRMGKNIKAEQSADGKRWQIVGTREVELERDVYVGLAVACPGETGGSAVFDEMMVTAASAAMAIPRPGLVLRSGSVVTGALSSLDEATIRLYAGVELSIPTSQAALLAFHPLKREDVERLKPGRTGVLLSNGDFYEGAVAGVRDGRVRVNSVVFGTRTFSLWDQAVAGVLHDVSLEPCDYEVRTIDGSVIRAKAIAVRKDRFSITDAGGLVLIYTWDRIAQIKAVSSPG